MESYETYMNVSFNLGTGVASTNFIRAQFDYGIRQRRAVKGYDTFDVRLVLDEGAGEMTSFLTLWGVLNFGNDKFTTDEVINGDKTTGKIVRFTAGSSMSQQIGDNKFIITVPLELIQTGV